MRPLYYDFNHDPVVVNGTATNDLQIVHQYLFGELKLYTVQRNTHSIFPPGPRLLVAPVSEQGEKTKDVYLPELSDAQKAQRFTWIHW